MPAIEACNVGLAVEADPEAILEDVSLVVNEGEVVVIIGPSGCGKTSFLNMIAGLQGWTSGSILVRGETPRLGRPDSAYALARDALLPWRDAVGNVELALQIRGVPKSDRRQLAMDALDRVGLTNAAGRHRAHLSQGMRQRVALARTFVTNPSLLILDEPFAALDALTRIAMQEVLLSLMQRFSGTVVLVTHDLAEAITLADRVVVFSPRPATVIAEYEITFPRPRDPALLRSDPYFAKIFDRIWKQIGQKAEL